MLFRSEIVSFYILRAGKVKPCGFVDVAYYLLKVEDYEYLSVYLSYTGSNARSCLGGYLRRLFYRCPAYSLDALYR